MAAKDGIGLVALHRSHHSGALGQQVEKLAQKNILVLLLSNSPKAIAPWGGIQPLFGTNPIAFAITRKHLGKDLEPLVIDLSLSKIARGKIMLAQQKGEKIPPDLALDRRGKITTDAEEALQGSLLPIGEAKGYALVLMVEIPCAAFTGSHFGFEDDSFFDDQGKPPGVGQFLLTINPEILNGQNYYNRLELLLELIESEEKTRLPGQKRYEFLKKFNGSLKISEKLHLFLTSS